MQICCLYFGQLYLQHVSNKQTQYCFNIILQYPRSLAFIRLFGTLLNLLDVYWFIPKSAYCLEIIWSKSIISMSIATIMCVSTLIYFYIKGLSTELSSLGCICTLYGIKIVKQITYIYILYTFRSLNHSGKKYH